MPLSNEAIQGLLAFGMGTLANNTGNYGMFGPAVGKGGLLGLQQYGNAQQNALMTRRQTDDEKFRKFQMDEATKERDRVAAQESARKRLFGQMSMLPILGGANQQPEGVQTRPMPIQTQIEGMPLPAQNAPFQGPMTGGAWNTGTPTMSGGVRPPAQTIVAPPVEIEASPMEDPAYLRNLAVQAASDGLTQEATFLNGLANRLEDQQNKDVERKEKTFTDNQGIVRYFNTGAPVAQQEPKVEYEEVYDPTSPSQTRLVPKAQAAGMPGSAKIRATQVSQTVGAGPRLTPGQESLDKKFADEYVAWSAAGGYADVVKQLDQLREASKTLSQENVTGPIIGNTPDAIKQFVNPRSIAVRDEVQEVVQRNLRLVLGAQFTQVEGEKLVARAFNPSLSEKENKKRIDRLILQIQSAAQAKQSAAEYFERNGTLQGWKGKIPSIQDFDLDREERKPSNPGLLKGQVVDGYKWNGGDPALESSWEKQ